MTTHVDSRGRIVIPASIRRKLAITQRTPIHMSADEQAHHIILTPITREYVNSLRGKYKGKGLLKALKAEKVREMGLIRFRSG